MCPDLDRETGVSTFLGLSPRGREIKIKTLCNRQETGNFPKKILERKSELAVRGKKLVQQNFTKLKQKWRSNIGKREIQMWLFLRSIKTSSLNDFSYSKRIDGQIRLKE